MAISGTYTSALGRWLEQQKQARAEFGRAEAPLTQTAQLYAPGGGYGAGQKAIIEEEARKARIAGQAELSQSGMWSGTAHAGLRARLSADKARALLGVEDVRTERQASALSQLSGLRAAAAQQYGTVTDPYTTPYIGAQAGLETARIGAETSRYGVDVGARTAEMETAGALQRAQLAAETSRYGVDVGATTSKYGVDVGLQEAQLAAETSRYGVDVGAQTQQQATAIQSEAALFQLTAAREKIRSQEKLAKMQMEAQKEQQGQFEIPTLHR